MKFKISAEGALLQPVTFTVALRSGAGPSPAPPPAVWGEVECVWPGCRNLQEAASKLYARRYNLPDNEALYKVSGRYARKPGSAELLYVEHLEVECRDEAAARDWWRQYCRTVGRRDRAANAAALIEEGAK